MLRDQTEAEWTYESTVFVSGISFETTSENEYWVKDGRTCLYLGLNTTHFKINSYIVSFRNCVFDEG